ncbi:hypothetical protein BpHYR1_007261 [Brachionus plicatilis]|uniref:Uncharacterized protein n=1 Tax=Brachionus plicatilis TaxID=10195 RepID=A0A3M7T7V0_BRAPC|nr:hypothetical protein BpHYR1_007261 [Brachionus plicatilis]
MVTRNSLNFFFNTRKATVGLKTHFGLLRVELFKIEVSKKFDYFNFYLYSYPEEALARYR